MFQETPCGEYRMQENLLAAGVIFIIMYVESACRRVYDSCHLQADCQEPGSAWNPTLGSRVWATFRLNPSSVYVKCLDTVTIVIHLNFCLGFFQVPSVL